MKISHPPERIDEYRDRLHRGGRTLTWPAGCGAERRAEDIWAGPGGDHHEPDIQERRLALLRDAVLVSGTVVAGAIAGGLVWMLFPEESGSGQLR
ncbi:Uncharacterised protein [Mycobacteroides abscessus subsp. abscessus]|uniref:hypothetical protein n=1 Tax=Mycobacteroides abscessus TaxID=36809 RepID=UPI0009A73297|nr:hypothetical protein [Mycobacteroides abscessus]SLI19995.1 Uncharacterised protein [Mycobacteroides abscessus subsp. abscessus]